MRIKDSVVLVTGANRGLGLAFVRALRAAGAKKIYAGVRNPDGVKIEGAIPIRLDVTNEEQVTAAAQAAGDVELVINNAGIAKGSSFLGPNSIDAARAEIETNYFGPLRVSQAFAPVLAKNGGGAIVNVLSVLSWLNFKGAATYSASKAAAWSLSNGLRNELRGQGTQVVALHVGYMDTDMAAHAQGPKADPNDVAAQTLATLEAGQDEVLADDVSRNVKAGLSANPGVYLQGM